MSSLSVAANSALDFLESAKSAALPLKHWHFYGGTNCAMTVAQDVPVVDDREKSMWHRNAVGCIAKGKGRLNVQ
jgi:hypothetical protein